MKDPEKDPNIIEAVPNQEDSLLPPPIELPYLENRNPTELSGVVLKAITHPDDPRTRSYALEKLGLTDMCTNEEIEIAINQRIYDYIQRKETTKNQAVEAIKDIERWLDENSFTTSQSIEKIPLALYDPILQLADPDNRRIAPTKAAFHPGLNKIILGITADQETITHEYGHAASHDPSIQRTGWAFINEHGLPDSKRDNRWLDEGSAVSFELANSSATLESYDDPINLYPMFYRLTHTLREELGVSERDFMQAYLAPSPERTLFEQKIQERYNCSVFDLDDIMIGYGPENETIMKNLLQGKPTNLELPRSNEGGMIDKYQELQAIFPNLTLTN